ncbi:MAG: restriction endonuclease subunit S [Gammaproteobacteria bacterium]|jgi:type I restriction enzyme S subunit|nr:restriction endonuclease subunit S [Gammaproteobacteria bacterium]MBT4606738.1 restriction endonuclease subunit S [Thiotrichales bacterium]MBT3968428.1 restriction endonuclease subunit S [Gammaproteobacteria bacterium]MBT4080914.1 restriction endonuclease subunit S [Gammaproteobacteria bacterium]MBT4329452.1 restriction endonuclease subunit S [Gammaproteobacteria bacterium]
MGGKYQAYPEYKDSGVEWLGEIPSHWCSTQIKYGYDITLGKMLQKEAKTSEDQLKPYLKAINIQPSGLSLENVGEMWFSPNDMHTLRLRDWDVLVSEGGDVGRSVIWRNELQECYIQNAINRARPIKERSSGYLFYWLRMLKDSEFIDILCNKATIAHFTAEKLECSPLLLPPDEDTNQIANFLDHETAKIDTLIEKQQQLIKLLKEKRQAVISHAVTKGLNPDAPMRDSGVEWLGEVPEHWAITRFKFVCDRIIAGPFGSSVTKDMYVKRGYKVYGQEQVIPNDFMVGDYYISEKDYTNFSRYVVSSGDVLISCVGTFGMIAVFPEEAEPGIINPRLIKAEVNSSHSPYYIREFLKSETVFKQFELLSRGGTMGVINIAILSEIVVAVPALDEQNEIITYINNEKLKYRTLIEHADRAVNLLQERRTALISAAVTGKIDIRDWVAPEQPTNKEAAA